MKKITVGDFEPMVEGKVDGHYLSPDRWYQLRWPDGTITEHQIWAEDVMPKIPFIMIEFHGHKIPVLLAAVSAEVRHLHWIPEGVDYGDPVPSDAP